MIYFRSRGAQFGECWFDDDSPTAGCDVDVLAFRQLSSPVAASHCTPILTLVSELTPDADGLLARLRQELPPEHFAGRPARRAVDGVRGASRPAPSRLLRLL